MIRAISIVFFGALPASFMLGLAFPLFLNKYGLSLFAVMPLAWVFALAWFLLGVWGTRALWLVSDRPVTQGDIPALAAGIVALVPMIVYSAYVYRDSPDVFLRFSWVGMPPATAVILIVLFKRNRNATSVE